MGLVRVGEKSLRPCPKYIMIYNVASQHTRLSLGDHISLPGHTIRFIGLRLDCTSDQPIDHAHVYEPFLMHNKHLGSI